MEKLPTERIEIDVADERYAHPRFWLQEVKPDIYLRMADPDAPGAYHLSDATLQISESGEYAGFSAYMGSHCFGVLWGGELRESLFVLQPDGPRQPGGAGHHAVRIRLYEIQRMADPAEAPNGVEVVVDGDSLSLEIGRHIFGVAKGPTVTEFFRRAWLRVTLEPEAKAA